MNIEVGAMRAVLKAHRLWEPISDGIEMLRERRDVGRALSYEEENRLIEAAGKSRSPALLPLLVITLDTGLRAAEIRSLRCNDLSLVWKNAVVESGFITVPKSKTEAGTGRTIPLSRLPALRSRSGCRDFPNRARTLTFSRAIRSVCSAMGESRMSIRFSWTSQLANGEGLERSVRNGRRPLPLA